MPNTSPMASAQLQGGSYVQDYARQQALAGYSSQQIQNALEQAGYDPSQAKEVAADASYAVAQKVNLDPNAANTNTSVADYATKHVAGKGSVDDFVNALEGAGYDGGYAGAVYTRAALASGMTPAQIEAQMKAASDTSAYGGFLDFMASDTGKAATTSASSGPTRDTQTTAGSGVTLPGATVTPGASTPKAGFTSGGLIGDALVTGGGNAGRTANNSSNSLVLAADTVGKTEAEKIQLYKNLRAAGYSDTQIRNAADSQFGKQSDADWSYLLGKAGMQADRASVGGGGLTGTAAVTPGKITGTAGTSGQGAPKVVTSKGLISGADSLSSLTTVPLAQSGAGGLVTNNMLAAPQAATVAAPAGAPAPAAAGWNFGTAAPTPGVDTWVNTATGQRMTYAAGAYNPGAGWVKV